MSANTEYYVRVLETKEQWLKVNAVTHDEARVEAAKQPGVMTILEVRHWSSAEQHIREDAKDISQ